MDWLTFISNIVGSLAWPMMVVIIIFLFKTQLERVFLKLTKFKYKEMTINFGNDLADVKELASDLNDDDIGTIQTLEETDERLIASDNLNTKLYEIADVSPEASIPFAWSIVEDEIRMKLTDLAISLGVRITKSPVNNMRLLEEHTDIDKETVKTLTKLRIMRNEVIHKSYLKEGISISDAYDYIKITQKIIVSLRKLGYISSPDTPQDSSQ
ncbi:MAG: hypothetical protein HRU29_10155 [Rhizobiales bacterium]|nr:hypothetical protein [Hyphomicrobiales bacterium]NRB14753.1 hypothetical protein [Hyphomicrobiales bacterium]